MSGLTSEAAAPTFLTQEEQQRAEKLERYEQAPGGPQDPPAGGGDEGGIPGLGVPYRDFIPTFPMVQDPATGRWRNAEPGEIAGAEGGEQLPPVAQTPPAEPPVVEQQPAPAPPDGDGDGIPNEYGDGPDLDANGIPDEVGINPGSLQQPGYPNPSASVDWGGVGVPDPSVVPPSDATTTNAEAVPEEEYVGGSEPDGGWVPEEAGIDPYALQHPAYADPSISGDGTGDPYAGSSEPYVPLEEAPVPEAEDPDGLGPF